jgi:hypothetical protein
MFLGNRASTIRTVKFRRPCLRTGDWTVSVCKWNLVSWTQSKELVPLSCSETHVFRILDCLRLQVEPSQLDPIERTGPSLLFGDTRVSYIGFCLRLQVEPSQLDPIERAGPSLLFGDTRVSYIGFCLHLQVEPTMLDSRDQLCRLGPTD